MARCARIAHRGVGMEYFVEAGRVFYEQARVELELLKRAPVSQENKR